MEIIGIAGSVSLLSGWRLYLCIFATGIAMRADVLPLPEHLESLAVLGNPWVIGIAAIGALAEFFADKIMWLDSIWDTVHTLVRPVGGVLQDRKCDLGGVGFDRRGMRGEQRHRGELDVVDVFLFGGDGHQVDLGVAERAVVLRQGAEIADPCRIEFLAERPH